MTNREKVGKALYRLSKPIIRLWIKPTSVRVRVLVVNDQKEVLLVRTWIGIQRWSMPGGGIGLGEPPKVAAVREVREEAGIHVFVSELKELGLFQSTESDMLPYTVQGYSTNANGVAGPHGVHRIEILEAAWFPRTNLPRRRSPLIDEFLTAANL